MKSMVLKWLVFLTLFTLILLPVQGIIRGKLLVRVVDSQGEPIEGVKINLVSQKTSTSTYTIYTNAKGVATHGSLENHVFALTLEKDGYQPLKKFTKIPAGLLKKEKFTMLTQEEAIHKLEADDPHAQAINKYNQAVFYIKKEENQKALKLLKESISLDSSIYQSHYEIATLYFMQENYEKSISHLQQAIALDEENEAPYRLMAAVYEKMNQPKKAKEYTQLAQEYGGASGIDRYNEGVNFFNDGDMDSAISRFKEALKLDPELSDAYYQLGMAYVNKGENEKAIPVLEKYLELEPEGEHAEVTRSLIQYLRK